MTPDQLFDAIAQEGQRRSQTRFGTTGRIADAMALV